MFVKIHADKALEAVSVTVISARWPLLVLLDPQLDILRLRDFEKWSQPLS